MGNWEQKFEMLTTEVELKQQVASYNRFTLVKSICLLQQTIPDVVEAPFFNRDVTPLVTNHQSVDILLEQISQVTHLINATKDSQLLSFLLSDLPLLDTILVYQGIYGVTLLDKILHFDLYQLDGTNRRTDLHLQFYQETMDHNTKRLQKQIAYYLPKRKK